MSKIKGQLEEAQLHNQSSDPTNLSDGLMWLRTDTDRMKFYDGASKREVVTLDQTQTLTNKTLTSPAISSPTGLVKADVGLGNVDNTSDATKWAAVKTLTNTTFDADGSGNSITNIENADIKAAAGIAVNKLAAVTASRSLVSDASGFISASSVTSTEHGYLSGVTSAIQTQLDAKVAKSLVTTKGDLIVATANATPARIAVGANGTFLKANSAQTEGVEWGSVSFNLVYQAKTANYTVLITDDVVTADCTSGAITLTLPAVSGNTGKVLRFVKIDSSNNRLTLDGNGTEKIGDTSSLTKVMLTKNESMSLVCDGTMWQIVNWSRPTPYYAHYRISASTGNASLATSTTEVIDYDTLVESTISGIATGASWAWTCEIGAGGLYLISAKYALSSNTNWNSGDPYLIAVYKGAALERHLERSEGEASGGLSLQVAPQGTAFVRVAASEVIDIRGNQASGAGNTFLTGSNDGFVQILRVGD